MKNMILFMLMLVPNFVMASSDPNCTTMTTITTPNSEYNVLSSDCILRAQASSYGYIRFRLPTNPEIGDTYIFQENGASVTEHYEYYDEEYQEWVSGDSTYTGGMGILSTTETRINGVGEYWAVADGWQLSITFDGLQWVGTEGSFTP